MFPLVLRGHTPYAWIINQSLCAAGTRDPLLAERSALEVRYIDEVRQTLASRTALIPWQASATVGSAPVAQSVAISME